MSLEAGPAVACPGCEQDWPTPSAFLEDLEVAVGELDDRVAGNEEVRWWVKRVRRLVAYGEASNLDAWTLETLCVECIVDELEGQGLVDQEAG